MVTRRQSLSLLMIFYLAWSSVALAMDPIASIDRSVISIDDTLMLTIRVDGSGLFSSPDTAPLQKDFHVLSTSQSSRHSITNGSSQSSTEWTIALVPKREGVLPIPPLKVGDKATQGMTVTVQKRAVGDTYDTSDPSEPVFMESEISAERVYVQQQLIYTVRVFQGIQLDNLSVSEIELEDAVVEKLSQETFERRINNQRYLVHELRYAIFPQHSGSLTIPEVVFSANEIVSRQRGFFNLPGQGRPLRKLTRQYEIQVLEPPASFAQLSNNPWLPAADIQLRESWSADPDTIQVGDSITRGITLTAEGLLATQLPPQQFSVADTSARLYPDQGQTENNLAPQGVTGTRTDSAAIIPTREGKLELPPVTITWWDTDEQKIKIATIAGRTLMVKPAPASTSIGRLPTAVDPTVQPAPTSNFAKGNTLVWQSLAALFAALWFITLLLWWRSWSKGSQRETSTVKTDHTLPEEQDSFKQLLAVCNRGDATALRSALIDWAQRFWPDQAIHTLADIQARCDNSALAGALQRLDQSLYGHNGGKSIFDSRQLPGLLKQLREQRHRRQKVATEKALPALYNN